MAALAGLLRERGFVVRGSDTHAYPPMGDLLRSMDIPVAMGYRPRNLDPRPQLVIIGNVIRADNPEARAAMERGIPFMSFPAAVAELCLADRKSLVVAGTHGKTTTATLLVSALRASGADPGLMIGGIPRDLGTGFHMGTPPWFVLEGDEYDTAFFDKNPKFLHYRPHGVLLTSIEFDHADIYRDLDQVKKAFRRLVEATDPGGVIAACRDWPAVREVCEDARCKVVTYGSGKGARDAMDWRLEDVRVTGEGTSFVAVHGTGERLPVHIRLPGRHNAMNALGTLALCHALGMDVRETIPGLSRCRGVKRRQEIIGEVGGITVVDDFAHHPTAVKETLDALKNRYAGRRLVAVFEPRTNTSRRKVFQDVYPGAFRAADLVVVRDVPEPEKAPPGDRFSSMLLVEDLKRQGREAHFFPDAEGILGFLLAKAKEGDVVAILSNGDFEGLHDKLIEGLKKRPASSSRQP